MNTLFIVIFFIIGLIFGSFFNVVGRRLPKKMPFTYNRSKCPSCHKQLAWYELIPVVSFIWQRGKCRHCQQKIHVMYPVIELMTGFLFMYSYYCFGFTMECLTAILLVSLLMIVFVSDMTYMIIPNKVLLFFLPIFVIIRIIHPLEPWWSPIVGAVVGLSIIGLIIVISRGGMGGGDMKLFGLLGIVLGFKKILLTFLLACVVGALVGLFLLVSEMISRKQPMAFGPYIVVATLFAYFYGDGIISWYLSLLKL